MKKVNISVTMFVGDDATDDDIYNAVTNITAALGYAYQNGSLTDSEEHADSLDLQGSPSADALRYQVESV